MTSSSATSTQVEIGESKRGSKSYSRCHERAQSRLKYVPSVRQCIDKAFDIMLLSTQDSQSIAP